jgi:hypothetical protein
MRRILGLALGLLAWAAAAHAQPGPLVLRQTTFTYLFQTPGAWSQVLPTDPYGAPVTVIIQACSGGGAGGGGQSGAGTAGGGGGGAAACTDINGLRVMAASGATLSGNIGAAGTLATVGNPGGDGGVTTVTGILGPALAFPAGYHGLAGVAAVGGAGGKSAFNNAGMGGATAPAGGAVGTLPTTALNTGPIAGMWDGLTG